MPESQPAPFISRLLFPARPHGYHRDELLKFLTQLRESRADLLTEDEYAGARAELLNELASRPRTPALLSVLYILLVASGAALVFNKFFGMGALLLAIGLFGSWAQQRESHEKRNLSRADRLEIIEALLSADLLSPGEADILRRGIDALFEPDPRTTRRRLVDVMTTRTVDGKGRLARNRLIFEVLIGSIPAMVGAAVLAAGRLSLKFAGTQYLLVTPESDPSTYWIIVCGSFAAALMMLANAWSNFIALVDTHGKLGTHLLAPVAVAPGFAQPNLLGRIVQWAFYIAFINFFLFILGYMLLGGDAAGGKIENGRYFLHRAGHYKEVPRAVFLYSKVHLYTVFVTHPAAIAMAFCTDRVRKRASK